MAISVAGTTASTSEQYARDFDEVKRLGRKMSTERTAAQAEIARCWYESEENADSGVYAGIHFRAACQDGVKLGENIGRRAFAQHLRAYQP